MSVTIVARLRSLQLRDATMPADPAVTSEFMKAAEHHDGGIDPMTWNGDLRRFV